MKSKTYQKFTVEGSFYHGHGTKGREELAYLGLGIAGEAGETADAIKKALRNDKFLIGMSDQQDIIIDELGDVLWYIARLLAVFDMSLEDLMQRNHNKLCARYPSYDSKQT